MKKVFLGGTCNESTWRGALISILDIDYFDPVVKDWTVECQQKELKERETCDYCLYTLTPKMIGVYSIAEVVDDSNKRPDRTLLTLLKDDDLLSFTDGQWKSLQAVAGLVQRNGGRVFYSLSDTAMYLNGDI